MDLEGKKVVVIGASSGMGQASAAAAANAGAQVVLVGRHEDSLSRAAQQIGTNAQMFVADIAVERDMQRLFEYVGRFDHLVISAADLAYAPIQQFEAQAAQRVLASKVLGPFFAVKHGSPRIANDGSITFYAGVAAWKPAPDAGLVAAANGALAAFARHLAVELAPVRVNAVSPGIVATPSWDGMPSEQRDAFFAALAHKLPAGRVGKPEDLAHAVLFLIGNGFTTGTVLHVDGGHRLV